MREATRASRRKETTREATRRDPGGSGLGEKISESRARGNEGGDAPFEPSERVDGVDPFGFGHREIDGVRACTNPRLSVAVARRARRAFDGDGGMRARLSPFLSADDPDSGFAFVSVRVGREFMPRRRSAESSVVSSSSSTTTTTGCLNDKFIDRREIVRACFHASIRVDLYFYASGIPANAARRRGCASSSSRSVFSSIKSLMR